MRFESLSDFGYMFFGHENKWRYRKIFFIRTVGNILIISSILFVFSQFYPVIAAEVNYRWTRATISREVEEAKLPEEIRIPAVNPDPLATATPKPLPELKEEPVDKQFGLLIEKINANSTVVPDVDPYNTEQYDQALKKGVAHAKGTKYPGQEGNIYLFAHNTLNAWDIPKYNAVFFLLHNLDPGERITTYYQEQRYDYIVFDKQVHSARDLSPLENQYTESVLSLQTCWPPGTTWQRLIIRAKLDK
jgi:LPXTG-site transpeptidase (sortase) family protein